MTVTRIEELSRSRCKIYLEDSFAFVLYKGELRLFGVREQEELSEESYREIMQEVLPKRATLRCMNLLQSRAYTESKLRSKLKEGGYPQESIDSALAYVKSYHYVDDLQFAKDYIANQAGKKSKRVLERDLIARGVSRDEIEAAPQVGRPMVLQVMFLGAQQSPLIRSPERQRCAQSSPADACR